MNSARDDAELPAPGCPIRISPDQRLLSGSPRLFAASHALHRLLAPRHPPCALSSLTYFYAVATNARLHKPVTHMQLSKSQTSSLDQNRPAAAPGRHGRVELIGIEPTTSALQGRRSPN